MGLLLGGHQCDLGHGGLCDHWDSLGNADVSVLSVKRPCTGNSAYGLYNKMLVRQRKIKEAVNMTTTNKVLVLGLDGMEPDTTRRMVDAGRMPNVKKLLERGAARQDLELLGAMPTITPAQWTTLACGCYPATHGVTDFWNQAPDALDTIIYGLDSRLCQAEQLWNVTAEAGKKTLVWQWPGSSWPPSSNSENLFVVDGTQPASVNYSIANIDIEKYAVASKDFTENKFIDHVGSKNLGDAATDCVIDQLDLDEPEESDAQYDDFKFNEDNKQEFLLNRYKMKRIKNVDFHPITNDGGILAKVPFDKIGEHDRRAEQVGDRSA